MVNNYLHRKITDLHNVTDIPVLQKAICQITDIQLIYVLYIEIYEANKFEKFLSVYPAGGPA